MQFEQLDRAARRREQRLRHASRDDVMQAMGWSAAFPSGVNPALSGSGGAPAPTADDFGTVVEEWRGEDIVGSGATFTSWTGRKGNAFTAIGTPTYEATGWNGSKPTVLFNGTNNGLYCDAVASGFSGNDTPLYVACVFQSIVAPVGTKGIWCFGNSGYNSTYHMLETLASNRAYTLRRSDAFVQVGIPTSANRLGATGLDRIVLIYQFSQSAGVGVCTMRFNGVDDPAAGSLETGTMTVDRFSIGYERRLSEINFCNVRIGYLVIFSALTDVAGLETYLKTTKGYTWL